MLDLKPIVFLGNSLEAVRGFPEAVRRDAGFQLDRVQRGLDPYDWKPMKTVGPGVRELRVRDAGAFRVIYIATFAEAIYVLHAFQKQTQRTASATWVRPCLVFGTSCGLDDDIGSGF